MTLLAPNTVPIYCINLSWHPVSQMYMRKIQPSWKQHGYTLKLHEGVNASNLYKYNQLLFGLKETGKDIREFTATEKAVWYSHFLLWQKSVREQRSMIIIEHDSYLTGPIEERLVKDKHVAYLSFIDRTWTNSAQRRSRVAIAPGSGYFISPFAASQLVAHAVSSKIDCNSDGFLAHHFKKRFKVITTGTPEHVMDNHPIEQISIDDLNTIDHRKDFKNYVGGEEFGYGQTTEGADLSSVYGQE